MGILPIKNFAMSIPNLKLNHLGRKVVRIRELKGIKQETLAGKMGVSQQTISRLEQSEEIEEEKLKQIADALGVSVEAIENFNEEAAINIISSSFNDNATGSFINYNCTLAFNPIEKLLELVEENKKLYERLINEKDLLLKVKDSMIEMFKQQKA
jgi:transcriptional regulator with XRE-family HTH domain